jgi:hypothetical protein
MALNEFDELIQACSKGNLSSVERLLEDERVNPAADDNRAIGVASGYGHLAVVDRLLQDERVDPAAGDNRAIGVASLHGHLAIVKRLLQDERVDPAAGDNRAIQEASFHGHLAVVDRLLQDERVDPAALDNYAIHVASLNGHLAVLERLLQDARVDPAALHRPPLYLPAKQYPVTALTDAMLPRLAATLSLPFPADSCILLWQPRLREYRAEQMQFLEVLIASWQWHRGGLCRDIVENIVSEYALGGRKLREYGGLDAEYVRPPVLLVDPTMVAVVVDDADDDSSAGIGRQCCAVQSHY